MVTVAISIGKTILMFIDIMQKQIEVQQQIKKINNPEPGVGIADLLRNIMPGANVTSVDLSTPGEMPESIKNLMRNFTPGTTSLEEMGMEDLEKELSKAVKKDDYERAQEINKAIKRLKSLGGSDDSEENQE